MEKDSRFRLTRSGSFSIADILNKNPCEATGNFSVQTLLPEMDSKTITKSEQQVAKTADKVDSKDDSVEGELHTFAENDDNKLITEGKVVGNL